MGTVLIGTCGYGYFQPSENWKEKYKSKLQAYSDVFSVGEINRTFYQLPMIKTARRWRQEAFADFEFTLKAWQAITHDTRSPTWRRRLGKLTQNQKKNFGHLRPNVEVIEAWQRSREFAEALEARVCVLQTPGNFKCTPENEDNMRRFFAEVQRGKLLVGWEPRGDWHEYPDKIKAICNDLDLIHVVDIMRRKPLVDKPVAYIRLHGLNPKEYDYNYDYSEKELQELAERLRHTAKDHDRVYCMFNNFQMYANALRIMEILEARS